MISVRLSVWFVCLSDGFVCWFVCLSGLCVRARVLCLCLSVCLSACLLVACLCVVSCILSLITISFYLNPLLSSIIYSTRATSTVIIQDRIFGGLDTITCDAYGGTWCPNPQDCSVLVDCIDDYIAEEEA